MRFQHYDRLRTFGIVARHDSFAAAADVLNLTKGAVSHRIRGLERALGFALSNRLPRGISLTPGAGALADAVHEGPSANESG